MNVISCKGIKDIPVHVTSNDHTHTHINIHKD